MTDPPKIDPLDGGLPRAVAISWGMVADPQRGPKRELNHERIVAAAIKIADAEGLGAVTMSKVAAALGFTTMALYRYVTSKDDLLELMADAAAGEVVFGTDQQLDDGRTPVDVDDDWAAQLRRFAGQSHAVYQDHPWLGDLALSKPQLLTPNNLAIADLAMRCMRGLRLADSEKLGVLVLITNYVRATRKLERDIALHTKGGEDRIPAELITELITDERFPDLAPLARAGRFLSSPPDGEPDASTFEFGLEILLAGVAAHAERGGRTESVQVQPGWRNDDQAAEAMGLDHVRKDGRVREAIGKRREAEGRLREARKHEREMIKNALERGPKK